MRFAPESLHDANAGLQIARGVMEKVKEEFPWISYGDLWTLAGVSAIQEMAGRILHVHLRDITGKKYDIRKTAVP